jgi:DNA-directed RNA polymerase beta subunit
MPIHRFYLSDFVTIQRQSFFQLLETGLIAEFSKRNPITNLRKNFEVCFYPEYYILTRPKYNPQEAIFKNKSYISKLYVPVQFTDINQKNIGLRWILIGYFPIMTKRGHFILNGAARVIINQILRSPGVYYQQKIYETNLSNEYSVRSMVGQGVAEGEERCSGELSSHTQKPTAFNETIDNLEKDKETGASSQKSEFKRYYADLISMRGTWLRIEMDKEKNIWAQMKKGPKIPIYWFLLAMGLSEKIIFKSILNSQKLLGNLKTLNSEKNKKEMINNKIKQVSCAESIFAEGCALAKAAVAEAKASDDLLVPGVSRDVKVQEAHKQKKSKYVYLKTPPEAWKEISLLFSSSINRSHSPSAKTREKLGRVRSPQTTERTQVAQSEVQVVSSEGVALNEDNTQERKQLQRSSNEAKTKQTFANIENGRRWLYNRFMNPRSYDLGKQGRLAFNQKLGLNIKTTQLTLTGLDVLYATDYLIKVEKGIHKTDDIDHLKNRRVRTSGELIQIQVGVGLVRLEKSVRDMLNKESSPFLSLAPSLSPSLEKGAEKRSRQRKTLSARPSFLQGENRVRSTTLVQGYASPFAEGYGQANAAQAKKVQAEGEEEGEARQILVFSNNSSRNEKLDRLSPASGVGDNKSGSLQSIHSNDGTHPSLEYSLSPQDIVFAPGEGLLKATPSSLHQANLALVSCAESHAPRDSAQGAKEMKVTQVQAKAAQEMSLELLRSFEKSKSSQKEPNKMSSKTILKRKHLFLNPKAFNSAIREFFGTSPLSQFMDQINPLAELTHKRRLSSMGPGGVTRDSATLEIRGIHPTHYGRICPIETPEGKNTGLVNSMTTYARVNPNGIIESPFYKVFKGQVQQNVGMFYFSAEQEEKIKLAAADLSISSFGFLPKAKIPVRIIEDFTKMARSHVQYIGVSPLQMISIATSLIPFLEHDDANRALMGSNMQRQAVPLIRPERPIVGTGLEARVVSDSGQAVITKYSGFIHYVSANKIVVSTLRIETTAPLYSIRSRPACTGSSLAKQ